MKKITCFLLLLFCTFQTLFSQYKIEKINSSFEKLIYKGYNLFDSRKTDSCNYYITQLDNIRKESPLDSSRFHRVEVLKAATLIRKNKTDQAIEKILKAEKFFKKEKDSFNIGLSQLKLGVANYYMNRRLVTRDYMHKALKNKNHLPKKILTRIHQNIGSINLEEGGGTGIKNDSLKYEAIKKYKKVIAIYKKENWLMEESLATSLMAEAYKQLGNIDKALLILEDAILAAKKGNFKSQLGFALIKKASFLGSKKRYNKALKTIRKAKPIFKKLDDHPTLQYALIEEKKILINLKKFEEATKVGDSLFITSVGNYNIKFAEKVSEMETKYKTAEKEKKIAIQKEQLLAKELDLKNKKLFSIILGCAFLFLCILSIAYYNRSKFKRKQLEKEIRLKEALSKIKTQNRLQEQRLRISRDLHDNIGSQLTFIISSIDNLKYISKDASLKLKDKLSNISSFTTDTIYELRDTIWAMNKNTITFDDIHTRSLSFIEKAKVAKPGTKFITNFSTDNSIKLSSTEGMNIFRVIQEAINNALKYAEAEVISLQIHQIDDNLIINIIDNGKGFDIKEVTFGNGLSNIEKRISEIKGNVFINSKKGKGTSIKIEVKNTSFNL